MGGELEVKQQRIDANYVDERLSTLIKDQNLRQYVL
jgi:ATP-dependent protease HslVU (ClpYQ) ATPase subunit